MNMSTLGSPMRLALISVLAAAAVALLAAAVPAQSQAAGKRVCGIKPGQGYYNLIKTRNVSCRTAKKVSKRAGRNFCGKQFRKCNVQPGEFRKGRTKAKGWRCRMKLGWEFYRATCERRNQRFRHETAA